MATVLVQLGCLWLDAAQQPGRLRPCPPTRGKPLRLAWNGGRVSALTSRIRPDCCTAFAVGERLASFCSLANNRGGLANLAATPSVAPKTGQKANQGCKQHPSARGCPKRVREVKAETRPPRQARRTVVRRGGGHGRSRFGRPLARLLIESVAI